MGSHANKSPPAGLTSGRWDAGQLLGRQMVLQDKGLRLLGMGAERADLGSAWEAVSRKQIARPRITGRASAEADRAKHQLHSAGDSRVG